MLIDDIINLINQGVADQHELLEQLNLLGHRLTQSTISRKLKLLGITKLHGKYQFNRPASDYNIIFCAPNLIIIKCQPGHANVIAAILDNNLIGTQPEFIASLAGDDTIFLAVDLKDSTSTQAITKVRNLL